MQKYNLSFISDEDLFVHVKGTVENTVFNELGAISPKFTQKSLSFVVF